MTTNNDKNDWNDRLKTADNSTISELLHNFGLSGGFSARDLPYIPLTGLAAMAISPKIKALRERNKAKEVDDNKNVDNFSEDTSKIRDTLNQRKTDKPVRNHPSVPGFNPDVKGPYGIFDYETNDYTGETLSGREDHVVDIREHPRFNSVDQGRAQRGRPFDRDEE